MHYRVQRGILFIAPLLLISQLHQSNSFTKTILSVTVAGADFQTYDWLLDSSDESSQRFAKA